MRIIAGEFRGRKLLAPEGDTTRPITDRVKQSLFDILTPLLPDARVYDCFAGTGSMGLESLSRGAARATFFEADHPALTRLRKNIDALQVKDRCKVVGGDLFQYLANPASAGRVDIIFLDPPYRFLHQQPADLQRLARNLVAGHLQPAGMIVFRHDAADSLALPGLAANDQRTYGGMTLEFLQPAQPI